MSDPESYGHLMKSKGGISRVFKALGYTWDGLKAAAQHEEAFKQELYIIVPLSIAAWLMPVSMIERALLFSVLQLILIVELLNSAIEANTDHISLERHPLAKRAKDMGSAAVLLSLFLCLGIWSAAIWKYIHG